MQPLTHQMWAKHFAELRPYVLAEWPQVAREDLDLVGDDWDGLVELVSRSTGMSADLAVMQLRKLDVAEMGIGSGETDDDEDADEGQASLDQLRLGVGFSEDERDRIVERLSKLNRRLRRFPADGTDLELSVKERDSSSMSVTLEAWLPGFGHIVATSKEDDLRDALMDVREDLWRRIDDAVGKRTEGRR